MGVGQLWVVAAAPPSTYMRQAIAGSPPLLPPLPSLLSAARVLARHGCRQRRGHNVPTGGRVARHTCGKPCACCCLFASLACSEHESPPLPHHHLECPPLSSPPPLLQPMAWAATFNPALTQQVASQIGDEMRGRNNAAVAAGRGPQYTHCFGPHPAIVRLACLLVACS